MMEGDARNVDSKLFLDCVSAGLDQCSVIARDIEALAEQHGKTKTVLNLSDNLELREKVKILAKGRLRNLFSDSRLDKLARDRQMFSIRDDIVNSLKLDGVPVCPEERKAAADYLDQVRSRRLVYNTGLQYVGDDEEVFPDYAPPHQ